jgi:hypothetical protein
MARGRTLSQLGRLILQVHFFEFCGTIRVKPMNDQEEQDSKTAIPASKTQLLLTCRRHIWH